MARDTTRVGLIGYGQIGRAVHEMIDASDQGMEVVFVHDQEIDRLVDLPEEVALEDLGDFADLPEGN